MTRLALPEVTVHVAAASSRDGRTGWAAVLAYGSARKALSGDCSGRTHNAALILAIVEAVEALRKPVRLTVRTSSRYVFDSRDRQERWSINNWMTRRPAHGDTPEIWVPVANADLWAALRDAVRRNGHRVGYFLVTDANRTGADDEVAELARVAHAAAPLPADPEEAQPRLAL